MHSDDERLGQVLGQIRRRGGLRQIDVGRAADVPTRDVMLIEAGRAGEVAVDRVRRVFAAAGGRAQ